MARNDGTVLGIDIVPEAIGHLLTEKNLRVPLGQRSHRWEDEHTPCMISISNVEKQNQTLRMHCRRLTKAFSKNLENFKAAVAPPVDKAFQGKTVWKGYVEVFDIYGHPKAKRAYGWIHVDGKEHKDEKFVTVLEVPPVDSPQKAIKVAVVAEIKKGRKS